MYHNVIVIMSISVTIQVQNFEGIKFRVFARAHTLSTHAVHAQ